MKTPITYYGGKQKLAEDIISMMPKHKADIEAFVGGGAIFFTKPKSEMEIINDTNRALINFYSVAQREFVALQREVNISLHSRSLFNDASVVYNNPHMFNEIKYAWSVWALASMGFAGMLDGSYGFDLSKNTTTKKIANKRDHFTDEVAIRLQNVNIERDDAIKIIKRYDQKDAFHYCDPPYFNSDCGHYDGYSKDDFENLLKTLEAVEGKFMLSSYHSDILKEYTTKNGWHQWEKESAVSVSAHKVNAKRKIEVVTANYDLSNPREDLTLF
jgi:DNA adenine methylase